MSRITRIILYDAATEIGLGESDDKQWVLFEGPVLDQRPYRWIARGSNYPSLHEQYLQLTRAARERL